MQKKFLEESVGSVVGKSYERIVDLLLNKKHVNEFLIAKKLDLTINQTRNILYKLQDNGMVSAIRKKDKKKGWYTYFWRLEVLKILEFLRESYLKKIEQLNNQIINRESKNFYICSTCNIEFNETNALVHDFTCPECGEVLVIKDNAELLKQLNRNLNKIKESLASLEKEILKEKEKIQKKEEKELASILKKKKTTEKKSAKKKTSKKTTKKKAVKKVKKKILKKKVLKKKISKKLSKKISKKKTSKKTTKKKAVKKVKKK